MTNLITFCMVAKYRCDGEGKRGHRLEGMERERNVTETVWRREISWNKVQLIDLLM